MSVLPQLERDLMDAASRRRLAGSAQPQAASLGTGKGLRGGLRLPLIVAGCLLASATIALAASGVIPVGAPVKPRQPLNPDVGVGMPLPGASRLLPLRVPDPYGGLPWGMRVVRTTRGEVCVQVGRVEDGQLGELGLDGAFHDDGSFHPIPADAQAEYYKGLGGDGGEGFAPIGGCELAGSAQTNKALGDDRNAGVGLDKVGALRHLRNIYWGLLGPDAVSVRYGEGQTSRTLPVVQGLGAYLLVSPSASLRSAGYGDGSTGTPGLLAAGDGLSAITYRLDGRLCERGATTGPDAGSRVPHPCPQPHWPRSSGPLKMRNLHLPVHRQLVIHDHFVTGVRVSFLAPYAIASARYSYTAQMPGGCERRGRGLAVEGYVGESLDRDVARGAVVHFDLGDPFATIVGCRPRANVIRIVYQALNGGASTIVGIAKVRLPPGTRPAPIRLENAWSRRRSLLRQAASWPGAIHIGG